MSQWIQKTYNVGIEMDADRIGYFRLIPMKMRFVDARVRFNQAIESRDAVVVQVNFREKEFELNFSLFHKAASEEIGGIGRVAKEIEEVVAARTCDPFEQDRDCVPYCCHLAN